jgi:hypothetical protein
LLNSGLKIPTLAPPLLSRERDPDSPFFNAATTAHNPFYYLAAMLVGTSAFVFVVIYLAIIVLARRAVR